MGAVASPELVNDRLPEPLEIVDYIDQLMRRLFVAEQLTKQISEQHWMSPTGILQPTYTLQDFMPGEQDHVNSMLAKIGGIPTVLKTPYGLSQFRFTEWRGLNPKDSTTHLWFAHPSNPYDRPQEIKASPADLRQFLLAPTS